MEIKNGGQLESLKRHEKLTKIRIYHERGKVINLTINESSLSYLSVEEAIDLKIELEKALAELIHNPH